MVTSSESEMTSFWDCLEAAVSAHRQGRLDEASEVYRRLLADQPDDPHLLHLLALIALQKGNGDATVAYVERALAGSRARYAAMPAPADRGQEVPSTPSIQPAQVAKLPYPPSGEAGIEEIFVELTSRCNLRCRYCAVSLPDYVGRDMAPRHVEAVLEFATGASIPLIVSLNVHGETTEVEGWTDLSGRFLATGARLNLISNFARYFSEEEISTLARYAGIRISIDSVDRKLLREIRRSVDLRIILHNLTRLRATALRQEGRIPLMGINCVVSDKSVFGVKDLVAFAAANGFSDVTLHDLAELTELPDDRPRHISTLAPELYRQALDTIRDAIALGERLRLRVDVQASLAALLAEPDASRRHSTRYFKANAPVLVSTPLPGPGETRRCLDPWRVVKVEEGGGVASCCIGRTLIGHLDEAPLSAIVSGEAARQRREELATGKLNAECRFCPARPVVTVATLQAELTAWKTYRQE